MLRFRLFSYVFCYVDDAVLSVYDRVSTGPLGTVPSGTVSKWVRLGLVFPRDRFRFLAKLQSAPISFLRASFIWAKSNDQKEISMANEV